MKHTCHARNCAKEVPPKLLMCLKHWRMVPRDLQRAVWAAYHEGQEITKDPSLEYLRAARAAIQAVAAKEAPVEQNTLL
jgi:hypothetical protein